MATDSERLDFIGKMLGSRDIRRSCDARMGVTAKPGGATATASAAGRKPRSAPKAGGAARTRSPTRKGTAATS